MQYWRAFAMHATKKHAVCVCILHLHSVTCIGLHTLAHRSSAVQVLLVTRTLIIGVLLVSISDVATTIIYECCDQHSCSHSSEKH